MTAFMRANRIKPRSKPRPGRLKGKDLEALRVACYLRDSGMCQECGCETFYMASREHWAAYHMAHIRGKRMHGDSLENVRVLCGSCHRAEHAGGKPVPKKDLGQGGEYVEVSNG